LYFLVKISSFGLFSRDLSRKRRLCGLAVKRRFILKNRGWGGYGVTLRGHHADVKWGLGGLLRLLKPSKTLFNFKKAFVDEAEITFLTRQTMSKALRATTRYCCAHG